MYVLKNAMTNTCATYDCISDVVRYLTFRGYNMPDVRNMIVGLRVGRSVCIRSRGGLKRFILTRTK